MALSAQQITQLQQIEIELRQILEEKQSLNRQLLECNAAIDELANTAVSYKIIGSIMVQVTPASLLSSTKQKKSELETQLKNLEARQQNLTASHNEIVETKKGA